MKLVIHTQFRENYGAHDWDGEGACPQYWKCKGGSTYIVETSLEQAQDAEFYDFVDSCIEYSNDSAEEFVLGANLIDECDFVESDHVEHWDSPTYATLVNGALHCRKEQMSYCMDPRPVALRTWVVTPEGESDFTYTKYEEAA
jgi:hypothetical protein